MVFRVMHECIDSSAALPHTEVYTHCKISWKNSSLFNLLCEMTIWEILHGIQGHARVHGSVCGASLHRGVRTEQNFSKKYISLFNLLYEVTVSEFLRDIQRHSRLHRFGCGAFFNRGVRTEQNFSKNSSLFNLKWKFENFSMACKGMHDCTDSLVALS